MMDQLAIIRVFAALGLVLFCIILFGMVARKTGLLGKIRRNPARYCPYPAGATH